MRERNPDSPKKDFHERSNEAPLSVTGGDFSVQLITIIIVLTRLQTLASSFVSVFIREILKM